MVNKDFCLSSYLAYRFIYRDDMEFYDGMRHSNYKPVPASEQIKVKTAADINEQIKR